jgi:hypothetical protein
VLDGLDPTTAAARLAAVGGRVREARAGR